MNITILESAHKHGFNDEDMITMDNYEKIAQDIYDGRCEMKNVKALVPDAKELLHEYVAIQNVSGKLEEAAAEAKGLSLDEFLGLSAKIAFRRGLSA